jgi:hypothetical protein
MFVRNGDNPGGDHSDENEDDESDQSANHQIDPTDDEDRDSDTILNAFYGSNSYYDEYDDDDDDDDDYDDYDDDDDEDDTDDAEGTFDISNEDSDRLNTNSNSATEDRPNSLIFEVYIPSQVSPSAHDDTTTSTQSTVNDTTSSINSNMNTLGRNCERTDSLQDGRHQSC